MATELLSLKLEQELKYEIAYMALLTAIAAGKLSRDICQRVNVAYAMKCGALCRDI